MEDILEVFREDNTVGFSSEELNELNKAFTKRWEMSKNVPKEKILEEWKKISDVVFSEYVSKK